MAESARPAGGRSLDDGGQRGHRRRPPRCAAGRGSAHPGGGRRRPPAHAARPLPAGQRLSCVHRALGCRGPRQARRHDLRPARARRDDAGRVGGRIHARAAPLGHDSGPASDRHGGAGRPYRGAGERRRRLSDQALRAARAAVARGHHPAPQRATPGGRAGGVPEARRGPLFFRRAISSCAATSRCA